MDLLNLAALTALVAAGDVAVLSGAGLSTDSGTCSRTCLPSG
jgi:NAD-dependent SIR2 family protein deacetylase